VIGLHRKNEQEANAQLVLRTATIADARMIFEWRNMPEIVALGKSQRAVGWEEHSNWFQSALKDDQHLLLIVQLAKQPIGQVRFDYVRPRSCEVSIYLLPGYTGRGLGVLALRCACLEAFARLGVENILATIREDNQRSISAFQKAGFLQDTGEASAGYLVLNMKRPPNVPHNRITHDASEVQAVVSTLQSGQWASGPKVAQLEAALAKAAQVKFAVCVGSGTAGLRLTLKGLGIKPGDKVAVPAYSCVALANATLACDALPVPVDVTPDDWILNETKVAKGFSAAIAVNTFGVPALTDSIKALGIPVIEDCAHGFGMEAKGKALGGRAEAGILSFYATKLIGSGEGGAVLTNSAKLAQFVKSWRDYNDQPPDGTRLNDKMTDIEAALALSQLDRLDEMIAIRQNLSMHYDQLLSPEQTRTKAFKLPNIAQKRVWYRYAVEMLQTPAKKVIEHLRRFGITAEQPITDWRPPRSPASPVADRAYRSLVSLPLYPTLTNEEQTRVAHAFATISREYA
jgi:perosamine synthetase